MNVITSAISQIKLASVSHEPTLILTSQHSCPLKFPAPYFEIFNFNILHPASTIFLSSPFSLSHSDSLLSLRLISLWWQATWRMCSRSRQWTTPMGRFMSMLLWTESQLTATYWRSGSNLHVIIDIFQNITIWTYDSLTQILHFHHNSDLISNLSTKQTTASCHQTQDK